MSFNDTLKKDTATERDESEGRRISVSYATGVLGFILGILLGICVGVLCCSRIFGQESLSERAEKLPLNPKSDQDKLRVV